jgi:hypothetical protein
MGKQTNIKLSCTVGNIIYYQWKGIDCIRTVPTRVRQTKNTKKAASLFGVAVKSAATMRKMLRPVLPDAASRPMMYELDGAFRKWLYTAPLDDTAPCDMLPSFMSFSFNKEARPGKVFKEVTVQRGIDGDLLVQIPSLNAAGDITAPKGTVQVGITFMAAVLPFDDEKERKVIAIDVTLPYIQSTITAQEILLPGVTHLHCLSLVAMSMRFYKTANEGLPINQIRWQPTVIVGSFYN